MITIQIHHLRPYNFFHVINAEVINNNIKTMKEKDLRNNNILESYLMFLFHQASWFWLIKSVILGKLSNFFGPGFACQARGLN